MKRTTYARLLKPGDKFFSGGTYQTIYTVYNVIPCREGPRGAAGDVKVRVTTGKNIFYNHNERVQLV
jgi:hypothetical protein